MQASIHPRASRISRIKKMEFIELLVERQDFPYDYGKINFIVKHDNDVIFCMFCYQTI